MAIYSFIVSFRFFDASTQLTATSSPISRELTNLGKNKSVNGDLHGPVERQNIHRRTRKYFEHKHIRPMHYQVLVWKSHTV